MARTKDSFDYSSMDFSSPKNWSTQDRVADEKKTNARAKAASIVAEQRKLGESVSSEEESALADYLVSNGSVEGFQFAQTKAPAPVLPQKTDFSGVTAATDSTYNDDQGLLARVGRFAAGKVKEASAITDAVQAGWQNSVASAIERAAAADNPLIRFMAQLPGASMDLATGGIESVVASGRAAGMVDAGADADVLRAAAKANVEATQPFRESLKERNWLSRNLGEGVLDAAASPAGAASLIGGPMGAVSMIDAYNQAWAGAKDAGLEGEELEAYALSQAAPELISFIPAGKLLERIPVIKKWMMNPAREGAEALARRLTSPAADAAFRTAKTAVGESIEESLSGGMQDIAAMAFEGMAEGEAQRYAAQQAPDSVEEFLDNRFRDARAGVVFSGLSVPSNVRSAVQTNRQAKADKEQLTADAAVERGIAARLAQRNNEVNFDADLNKQLFEENQRRQDAEAAEQAAAKKKADIEKAEADKAKQDAEKKRLEEEAAFQTMERDRDLPRSRVERYGTSNLPEETLGNNQVVERVPVNPPAEITPEDVADAEEAAATAEAERVERVRRGTLVEELRGTQTRAQKKAEEAKKKEQTVAQQQEGKRRAAIRNELIAENPGVAPDDAALVAEYERRLAEPVVKKAEPTATEKRVAAIFNKEEGAAKSKETKKEGDAFRRKVQQARAANPDATPAEIAALVDSAMPATPTVTAAPAANVSTPAPVADKDAKDKDIDSLVEGMGLTLDMKSPAKKPAGEADTDENFTAKAKAVAKALVKAGSAKADDVQNLLRQGKIILASNPESVGQTSEGVASYNVDEGIGYIYLDRVGPKDATATIVAALHEGTHAGQFNDRQGRPSIYVQMMSRNGNNKASNTIRQAAAKGNKLAAEAVANAQAASPDTAVQDLELVPYFVGAAVNSRASTFGQLGGVVKDIKSGARSFLRDKLGADLDLSLDDINTAAQGVGGEIVATDLAPAEGGSLDMVVGANTPTGARLRRQGVPAVEDVDGRSKTVVSDKDSKFSISPDQLRKLLSGQGVRVGDIVSNPTISESYPELLEAKVYADPGTDGAAWIHAKNPTKRELRMAPDIVDGSSGLDAHNLALHELQHGIQHIEGFAVGGNPAQFRTQEDKALIARNRAAAANLREAMATLQDLDTDAFGSRSAELEVKQAVSGYMRNIVGPTEAVKMVEAATADTDNRYAKNLTAEASRAVNTLIETTPLIREMAERTTAQYNALRGEQESTFVENNRTVAQEDLPAQVPVADRTIISRKVGSPGNELALAVRGDVEDAGVDNSLASRRKDKAGIRSLDMAQPAAKPEVAKHYVPAIITGMFNADHGLPKEVSEILRHSTTSPAKQRMTAEATLGKYGRALDKLAAERGVTAKELNKEIETALDAATKDTKGFSASRAAFDAVADQYGKAGEALKEFRSQVDDLTLEILQQRKAANTPLTEAEKKLYSTLASNLGRYVHRQYASQAGKLGDKFANALWDDYRAVRTGKGKFKIPARITPAMRENYNTVSKAIDSLINNELLIPDTETLTNMSTERLDNLFATWGDSRQADSLTREGKMSQLEQIRDDINGDTGRLNRMAEEVAKEIIGLAEAKHPITSYYRGKKQDMAILKSRDFISEPVRKMMGEITDPAMRFMVTIAKQAEFVARNKAMLELTQNPGGELLPPGSLGAEGTEGWKTLEGEGYGAAEGWLASPNMYNAVTDVREQLATLEQSVAMAANGNISNLAAKAAGAAAQTWGGVAGTAKMMQIVWNPANFAFNLLGTPAMVVTNGNFNPVHYNEARKAVQELIAYSVSQRTASPRITELVSMGITDSAFIGEIKNEQYRDLRKLVNDMSGRSFPEFWQKAVDFGVAGTSGWKETYAMMDVVAKIANYYQQKAVLTDFYKKNGDLALGTVSEADIQREAADIAGYTNFTFTRVAPVLKAIERSGFSAFGPYMHEVVRTQGTNLLQGLNELKRANTAKTPEAAWVMRRQAAKRLGGQIATWGALGYVGSKLASIAFGDDEEEEKLKRKLLPEFVQNQDMLPIGEQDGQTVYVNASRVDPIGPLTDIMREINNGEASVESVSKQMYDFYVKPRVATQLMSAIAAGTSGKKVWRDPLAKQKLPGVYSELTDLGVRLGLDPNTTKAWANVFETFLPGATASLRDTNPRPDIQEAKSLTLDEVAGEAGTRTARAASYAGLTYYKLDAPARLSQTGREYKEAFETGRKSLTELMDNNPDRTAGNILGLLEGYRAGEQEAFRKVEEVYRAAKLVNTPEATINAELKKLGLTADGIAGLKAGRFQSQIISKASITSYKTKELAEAKTPEEKKQIEAKWNTIWSTLSSVQETLQGEDE